jgi:predicted RNA-binding protein YlxR (DUF448 family)
VRIVRGPDGVEVDPSGKKPGRVAIRKGRLDTALKTRLTPDEKLRLTEFVTTLNNAVAV